VVVLQRGPITYLVATAFHYDEARLYAVHRICEALLTGEPARRPPDFDLDTLPAVPCSLGAANAFG
jgi:WYL domain